VRALVIVAVLLLAWRADADPQELSCATVPTNLNVHVATEARCRSGTDCGHDYQCDLHISEDALSIACKGVGGSVSFHYDFKVCYSPGYDNVALLAGVGAHDQYVLIGRTGMGQLEVDVETCAGFELWGLVHDFPDIPAFHAVPKEPPYPPLVSSCKSHPAPAVSSPPHHEDALVDLEDKRTDELQRDLEHATLAKKPATAEERRLKKTCLTEAPESCGIWKKAEVKVDTDAEKRRQCFAAQRQCQHNCSFRENTCWVSKCDRLRPKASDMTATDWNGMWRQAKKSFAYDNCLTACRETVCYDGCPACAFGGGGGGQPTGRAPAQ
jgi:hypothetical protein